LAQLDGNIGSGLGGERRGFGPTSLEPSLPGTGQNDGRHSAVFDSGGTNMSDNVSFVSVGSSRSQFSQMSRASQVSARSGTMSPGGGGGGGGSLRSFKSTSSMKRYLITDDNGEKTVQTTNINGRGRILRSVHGHAFQEVKVNRPKECSHCQKLIKQKRIFSQTTFRCFFCQAVVHKKCAHALDWCQNSSEQ
jgi:hypothetical protein